MKGEGKTNISLDAIEKSLDIKIRPDDKHVIRTLDDMIDMYEAMALSEEKFEWILLDDIGVDLDKWGQDWYKRFIRKIVNIDREMVNFIIITDTYAVEKHIRRLSKLYIVMQRIPFSDQHLTVNPLYMNFSGYYDTWPKKLFKFRYRINYHHDVLRSIKKAKRMQTLRLIKEYRQQKELRFKKLMAEVEKLG
jgi:hypothetical protein